MESKSEHVFLSWDSKAEIALSSATKSFIVFPSPHSGFFPLSNVVCWHLGSVLAPISDFLSLHLHVAGISSSGCSLSSLPYSEISGSHS